MSEFIRASEFESIEQLQAHIDAWATDIIPFVPPGNSTPLELLQSLLDTSIQREQCVEELMGTIKSERKRLSEPKVDITIKNGEENPAPETSQATALTSGQEKIIPTSPQKRQVTHRPAVRKTAAGGENELWFDASEGLIGYGKKKSPVMYANQTEMLKRLNASCGQTLSIAQLVGEDNVDITTAAQIEQTLKKLIADLEKDPNNPQLFSVMGSGKGLSARLNHKITTIEKV